MIHSLPPAVPGMRIGLLGGSFDPPHAGHVHITRWALRTFGLDRIWWMVSPGNPLKAEGPAAIERRLQACAELMQHPRVTITDIELRLGTRYTAATLERLRVRYPGVGFTWLMGADNLGSLHKWEAWNWIMHAVPVGVLARPREQVRAGLSPAARRFADARLAPAQAPALSYIDPPVWTMLTGRMVDLSSTEIRRRGDWVR